MTSALKSQKDDFLQCSNVKGLKSLREIKLKLSITMFIYPTNMLGSDSNTSNHDYIVLDILLGTINQSTWFRTQETVLQFKAQEYKKNTNKGYFAWFFLLCQFPKNTIMTPIVCSTKPDWRKEGQSLKTLKR